MTCSDDLTSRVWNLDTGECISVLKVRPAGEKREGLGAGCMHLMPVREVNSFGMCKGEKRLAAFIA